MTTITNAELASAIQTVIGRVDTREDELKDWQSGTATGGPASDGFYPLTNLLGEVTMVKSPALLQSEVDAMTAAGSGAAAAAQAAQSAAEAALVSAVTEAQNASDSEASAALRATEALTYRNDAANSEANALAHRNAVEALALAFASVSGVPATPTSAGDEGEVVFDDGYLYVCISPNTWRRASLASW